MMGWCRGNPLWLPCLGFSKTNGIISTRYGQRDFINWHKKGTHEGRPYGIFFMNNGIIMNRHDQRGIIAMSFFVRYISPVIVFGACHRWNESKFDNPEENLHETTCKNTLHPAMYHLADCRFRYQCDAQFKRSIC